MEEEIILMEENYIEEINIEEENYSGKPYELPIASADTLGGIKVGENLTIDADGTLNAQAGGGSTEEDSGWLDAELTSDFALYDTNSKCRYRKIGNIVNVQFILSPKSSSNTINSAKGTTAFYLPEEYRPSQRLDMLCQGSGTNVFLLEINSTTGAVSIGRYRNSASYSSTPPPTTTWLPGNITYFVD